MLSQLKKYGSLVQAGLSCIPAKKGDVAITLHNLKPGDYLWFKELIDLIQTKYHFINPKDHYLVNTSVVQSAERRGVLLTFDDGFRSNYIVANQFLLPNHITALFFVTRKFIGLSGNKAASFAQKYFYPKRRLVVSEDNEYDAMSWSEIAWLIENGHAIGGHTDTHSFLSILSESEQLVQIIESADKLEQRIGYAVKEFAYPFGSMGAVNLCGLEIAEKRFHRAFSNIRGMLNESPSKHFIFRQNIEPGTPLWLIEAFLEGRVDWKYRKVRRQAKSLFDKEHA